MRGVKPLPRAHLAGAVLFSVPNQHGSHHFSCCFGKRLRVRTPNMTFWKLLLGGAALALLTDPAAAQQAGNAEPMPQEAENIPRRSVAPPGSGLASGPSARRVTAPGTPVFGAGGSPGSPGFFILPQDADWREPPCETLWCQLNAIDLGGGMTLSLQANGFLETQWVDDAAFGSGPDDDSSWDTRLNVYAGLRFNDRFRVYGALKHGGRYGEAAPPVPVESDDIDLHMLFAEAGFGGGERPSTILRVGRQELHYGAGRMISIRQGPNVRDDFDGVVLRTQRRATSLEAFAAFEVGDEVGSFDNGTVTDEGVWGLYTSTQIPTGEGPPDVLDIYYMGQRITDFPGPGGLADETRHYFGTRWFRPTPDVGFGWDAEATLLLGDYDSALPPGTESGRILAGSVTGELNASRGDWPWSPNLRLRAGYTTGDADPTDTEISTFRAPHPPGRYFGEFTPIGPGNLVGVTAAVELEPVRKLVLTPYVLFFWRVEEEDGFYSPAGTPTRGAAGSSHYLGWQYNLIASYQIDRHWSLFGEVGVYETSDFFEANPPDAPLQYAKAALQWRF